MFEDAICPQKLCFKLGQINQKIIDLNALMVEVDKYLSGDSKMIHEQCIRFLFDLEGSVNLDNFMKDIYIK